MSSILELLNNELSAVVDGAGRSLVRVYDQGGGVGAGTIWHSDGLVLTNAHVARHRAPKIALPDGRTMTSRIIARDQTLDLAALAVEARGLPTIEPGRSRELQPGQWVMAVGHPWGVVGAVTGGVVIGLESESNAEHGREWLVVGLHMRPGHSGGPLLDVEGRLVGINTMINGPDVGIAVPVHVVKKFLQDALSAKPSQAV